MSVSQMLVVGVTVQNQLTQETMMACLIYSVSDHIYWLQTLIGNLILAFSGSTLLSDQSTLVVVQCMFSSVCKCQDKTHHVKWELSRGREGSITLCPLLQIQE